MTQLSTQQERLKAHLRTALNVLKPPPRLSVSAWADLHRRLDSQSSAEPGRWYTSRAEYQRGIMDACSDPTINEVVVMAGAQLGKTETLLNVIGYHIQHQPCPILYLMPTVEMAQSFSKDRLSAGLLRSTPVLQDKVRDPRSRDSGNTTQHKVFPGGAISLTGSNAPSTLSSRPVRLVCCDEIDRYPPSSGTEGDPISLAKKRSATYWNRKLILTSTPTNKGASRIELAYEQSDQRQYHVPCKHCEEYQVLKWANVKWQKDQPETAAYCCEHCGSLWNESDRLWAVRNGQWIAQNPTQGVAGFHISALYSPWATLRELVQDFLRVHKNPEQLRVFVNTTLAETYEEAGETVDAYNLGLRREAMPAVPDDVLLIVKGADVQDARIEVSTVGIGKDDELWVLDHQTFYGDPSTPQLWQAVESDLFKTYTTETGREMRARATCVDSGGHFTNSVYQFCKRHYGNRVFAIKGRGGEGVPMAGRPSKNNVAKCPLFPVGVDTIKQLIFSRAQITEEGPGYMHFSDVLDDEYFRQLTAEKLVTKYHKGFQRRSFEKIRPRNEALDCLVYALAAYAIVNVNVNTLAARLASNTEDAKKVEQPAQQPRPFIGRPRSGFVNSWR